MSGDTLAAVRLGERVVDLSVADGRIARIAPTDAPARGLVLPLLADAHVHLDRTDATPPAGPTQADLRARAAGALAEAEAQGIAALRTHVDWEAPAPPAAWAVLGELAEDWRGRVAVQRAALVPPRPARRRRAWPRDRRRGGAWRRRARRRRSLKNAHLAPKLEAVFALALRFDLALDFHVDGALDRRAEAFDTIVALTRRHHLPGQVLCGHACALAVRPEAEVARAARRGRRRRPRALRLPGDRRLAQDARPGRTPRLRGLPPMQEARAAGMDVLVALDEVRDACYPFGGYDLLDAWRLAVLTPISTPPAGSTASPRCPRSGSACGRRRWCRARPPTSCTSPFPTPPA